MRIPEQLNTAIQNYLSGTASGTERQQVNDWFYSFNDETVEITTAVPDMRELLEKQMKTNIFQQVFSVDKKGKQINLRPIRRIPVPRKWGWVAAALILAIGSGIYYLSNQSSKLPAIIGGTGGTMGTREDVAPGTNRAILTINNNQNIDLASDKTGININSTITYNDGEKIADAGQLLQLTTPRGGQYQAVLPDGSKVWLNAASSIKFPSKFSKNERRVEVTGEAYFEVEKDASRPFKVSGGGQEIEVLGTSFNINIYNDEPTKKTTLITGSIKITNNNQTAILRPGQQANISTIPITQIKQITVQTDDVLAWKNGLFDFDGLNMQELMRQVERWYDVQVTYEKGIPDLTFVGKMNRNATLQTLLNGLQYAGVHYRLEKDRKLVILP